MKVRLLTILLILPFITFGQLTLAGRVTVCNDFKKNITIKGKLSYTSHQNRKKNSIKRNIDTLQVDIFIYRLDSLITISETDFKGYFNLTLPEEGSYKLRFELLNKIYKDTIIRIQSPLTNVDVCLSDSALHNHHLRKIPFDSIRAKKDIEDGTIILVTLISNQSSGSRTYLVGALSNEEKESIERKFGFKHSFIALDGIDQYYLDQRQREYNDIVYNYLDKINSGDSKRLINDDLIKIIKKKRDIKN